MTDYEIKFTIGEQAKLISFNKIESPTTQSEEEVLRDIIKHHNFKPSYMCSVGSMQTTDLTELVKEILKHFERKVKQ